jgi:hypothetical protein
MTLSRSNKMVTENDNHLISGTEMEWQRLFENGMAIRLVFKWFQYLIAFGIQMFASLPTNWL